MAKELCPRVHRMYGGISCIRRFLMVVEDFGVILTGNGRPTGPVYSTPEGAQFYDVTAGLTDVTGSELFKVKMGKSQELENAKRALEKIEKCFVGPALSAHSACPTLYWVAIIYDCTC